MTKLSLLFDQEIRFCMLGSSSMLSNVSERSTTIASVSYLYNLCIKAVCTTFGCCDAVAAAALRPFIPPLLCAASTYVPLLIPPGCSVSGLLWTGGPMADDAGGVISISSPTFDSTGWDAEGSIGIFRCPPFG